MMSRIPAENLQNCEPWQLPEIGGLGSIVPSAEKEDREKKAQESKAEAEAQEFVEELPEDEEITPITAEMLKQISEAAEQEGSERGYEAGFAKGKDEGYEQALAENRETLRNEAAQLSAIANELNQALDQQDQALESVLVEMVCKLTRSIVEREMSIDSSHILAIVKQAVSALPVGAKNLQIFLNPEDLAVVETYAEEQQKDWKFINDDELLPGGCRLHTEESMVDFSVEKRMEILLEQFVSKQWQEEENEEQNDEAALSSKDSSGFTAEKDNIQDQEKLTNEEQVNSEATPTALENNTEKTDTASTKDSTKDSPPS